MGDGNTGALVPVGDVPYGNNGYSGGGQGVGAPLGGELVSYGDAGGGGAGAGAGGGLLAGQGGGLMGDGGNYNGGMGGKARARCDEQ